MSGAKRVLRAGVRNVRDEPSGTFRASSDLSRAPSVSLQQLAEVGEVELGGGRVAGFEDIGEERALCVLQG